MSIQDRTTEFHALTTSASKRLNRNNPSSAHQRLLNNQNPDEQAKGRRQGGRGEFARRAAEIGRGITDTMGKLERLAMRMSLLFPIRLYFHFFICFLFFLLLGGWVEIVAIKTNFGF